jgi:hypothetical protein
MCARLAAVGDAVRGPLVRANSSAIAANEVAMLASELANV